MRDGNEAWCRANGVSGQWRTSPDPAAALARKIFEEALEYAFEQAGRRDPAELYDVLDALQTLLGLEDPQGVLAAAHQAKVAVMGGFGRFVEWCPVPEGAGTETFEAVLWSVVRGAAWPESSSSRAVEPGRFGVIIPGDVLTWAGSHGLDPDLNPDVYILVCPAGEPAQVHGQIARRGGYLPALDVDVIRCAISAEEHQREEAHWDRNHDG